MNGIIKQIKKADCCKMLTNFYLIKNQSDLKYLAIVRLKIMYQKHILNQIRRKIIFDDDDS